MHIAAHQIDDSVDVAHNLLEPRRTEIQHFVRSEVADISEIHFARRGDEAQPRPMGQLHDIGADISRRAVHQYSLATRELVPGRTALATP